MSKQLIVIGGGAAGFFCAVNVAKARPDLAVRILEKQSKVLQKVKVSGGGRCNVTNACFQPAELLKKYPNFNGVVIDPGSLGEPETDTSIRPDGKKVTVKARVEAPGAGSNLAPYQTLTFTEFIDPTGIVTYVHLLDLSKTEEDELMSDLFTKKRL